MTILEKLALAAAAFVGLILFMFGALFAHMVATGGLYGRGVYADATLQSLFGGLLMLALAVLPLAFVVVFAWTRLKRVQVPPWLKVIGWSAIVFGVFMAAWDVLTTRNSLVTSPTGAAMTGLYLGGLAVFPALQKRGS